MRRLSVVRGDLGWSSSGSGDGSDSSVRRGDLHDRHEALKSTIIEAHAGRSGNRGRDLARTARGGHSTGCDVGRREGGGIRPTRQTLGCGAGAADESGGDREGCRGGRRPDGEGRTRHSATARRRVRNWRCGSAA